MCKRKSIDECISLIELGIRVNFGLEILATRLWSHLWWGIQNVFPSVVKRKRLEFKNRWRNVEISNWNIRNQANLSEIFHDFINKPFQNLLHVKIDMLCNVEQLKPSSFKLIFLTVFFKVCFIFDWYILNNWIDNVTTLRLWVLQ